MGSKIAIGSVALKLVLVLIMGSVTSNLDQDRTECADKLVGLASCLPYVGGDTDAKTPTLDCCSGLKQVVQKSMKCLCVLIQDRNDPNLGLKINASLALQLPNACHAPINNCIDLLHLAPDSPDAKVFDEFTNSTPKNNNAPVVNGNSASEGTSAAVKSDAGANGKRLQEIEMVLGILILFLTSHLVF